MHGNDATKLYLSLLDSEKELKFRIEEEFFKNFLQVKMGEMSVLRIKGKLEWEVEF